MKRNALILLAIAAVGIWAASSAVWADNHGSGGGRSCGAGAAAASCGHGAATTQAAHQCSGGECTHAAHAMAEGGRQCGSGDCGHAGHAQHRAQVSRSVREALAKVAEARQAITGGNQQAALEALAEIEQSLTSVHGRVRPTVVNANCPMMGSPVDPARVTPALYREHEGQGVGFCCGGCPAAWDRLSDEQKAERLEAAGTREVEQPAEDNKAENVQAEAPAEAASHHEQPAAAGGCCGTCGGH